MTTQSLDQFFATFGSAPVRIDLPQYDEFLTALAEKLEKPTKKDLADLDKHLGKRFAVAMTRVAREGGFFLKPLSSEDRDFYEASIVGDKGQRNLLNVRARLLAKCWCFEDGSIVGPAKEVGSWRANILSDIFNCARDLNGMNAEDVEEAGKD